jgi:multisubunit Na+/H+ antiporter MnhF subunit
MCNIKVLTLQLTINCKISKIYYCEFIIIRGILIFVDFVYIAKARIWEFNEYVLP